MKSSQRHDQEGAGLEPIAVVGLACRFPGGSNPDEFWEFLLRGGDAVGDIPPERWDADEYYDPDPDARGKMYTRCGAFIADFDHFSPAFFGISPREAQFMDPQQRQLLEVHWEALENAGIVPQSLAQRQVGVFVGMGTTDYGDLQAALGAAASDAYNGTGGSHAAAAGRLSYLLGVRGPSLAIDTACSSSLVSVHLAMMSLRSGESEIAMASGVNLNFAPDVFVSLCKARMLSPDGRCKTFDAAANGYVRGEGCGVLVLKRLVDAQAAGDNILAVLRGSGTNHNGRSSGLTVPSGPAQQEVIRTALRNGGIDPAQIGFVEAHGTGTAVGDPIEAAALGAVFAGRRTPLLVGSVKTNCGHLEWAAGVCGLIKVILSMQRGVIPPNLHFRHPNPMIPWDKLPLRIVTQTTPWPPGKRIAGVSSFGFGGTNAHVIVEQAPSATQLASAVDRPLHLLTLSAKSGAALRQLADRFAEAVDRPDQAPLADVCFSANTGRSKFEYRFATVAASNQELGVALRSFAGNVATPKVKSGRAPAAVPMLCMLFTGQGAQLPAMGRDLYETQPLFRHVLQQCDAHLRGLLETPLLDVMYGANSGGERLIDQTAYTQPALFSIEYALAQLWQSWGVVPDVVIGHSVGEYAAACHAGVFELEEGLRLIAARGRLMQALPANGSMLAVKAPEERITPLVESRRDALSIAAVNGPTEVVVSGASDAIESLIAALRQDGIPCQKLNVSHAFHSPLMEPMLQEFASVAQTTRLRAPQLRLISNLTGREAGGEILTPGYWVRHVREAVRFAESIRTAAGMGCEIFVEAGPQPVLCALGRQCLGKDAAMWLPSLHSKRGNWDQILDSTAELGVSGVEVDWPGFDRDYARRRVVLPVYPFERQRYWFPSAGGALARGGGTLRPLVDSVARSPLVKETVFSVSLGVESQPYLADHKVHGQIVVPGAAYLSMLATCAELLEWPSCRIEDVYFLAPLVLAGASARTVQAVLTPVDGGAANTVQIAALPTGTAGEELLQLMSGRVSPGAPPAGARFDLQALRSACPESYDPATLYEVIDTAGVQVKESFRWVEQLRRGKSVALAKLRLPESIGTVDGYRLHPALLDAGFQVAGAILGEEEQNETLLPFSIRTLRQERPATGTTWWCHATRTGAASWDIVFLDAEGLLIAALDGFEMRSAPASVFLRRRLSDLLYRLDWTPQPLNEPGNSRTAAPGTWLLLDNGSQLGSALRQRLVARGDRVVLASERAARGVDEYAIDPREPGDFRRALQNGADAATAPLRGVVLLWGSEGGRVEEPARRAEALATGFLHLAQAAAGKAAEVRLFVVTRGAQSVRAGERVNPEQTTLWGIQRGLMLEAPELRITCIDFGIEDGAVTAADADLLFDELRAAPGDAQVAYRGTERRVARLVRHPDALAQEIDGPFRLQLRDYGSPDDLQLAPMARRKPARNQVEIAVKATALNFRDVVIALGMLKEFYARELKIDKASDIWLGFDCAGVIAAVGEGVTDLAVGDEVMSPAVGGAASHIIAYREAVMRIPKGIDAVTAASLPTVFWTAYHSLVQLAKLQSGERVLIHAAAGGVGLAAIQIAKAAGAQIFATASPGKHAYLRSQGVAHVMNSRTLDFAAEVLRATGGEGVDVVLNSLTGAVVEASFSVLKRGGRFVEIGRLGGAIPGEAERRPDAAYFTFELGSVIAHDPIVSIRTGEEICALFESGVAQPLPLTVYPIDKAAEAYRFMQQARHIGKVVLTLGDMPIVRGDSSYLVTGGLGGLGLQVAAFLAASGARHLVLAGRGAPSPQAQSALQALRSGGASVTVVQGDVAKHTDVADMIAACQAVAPLRGIIHAAGVLREALFRNQTAQTYAAAMAPKAHGAWQLHLQTRALPLDFFVCFSSMASLAGSPGQTNYCAANAFLDGLAHFRRQQGLAALSICFGPWADAGMAAGLELGAGIDKLSADSGIAALRALIKPHRSSSAQIGVMKIHWDAYIKRWPSPAAQHFYGDLFAHSKGAGSAAKVDFLKTYRSAAAGERRQLVEAHVLDAVRQVLGLRENQDIKKDGAWTDLGVDSLMMVEIKNRLEGSLGLAFPIELLMRDVSIQRVAEFVLGKLPDTAQEESAPAQAPERQPEDAAAMRLEIRESMHAIPQAFAEAEDQRARQVKIGGRWRCDFASCNYLGFDLEPQIMAAIPEAVSRWGTHPSWSRAVASPSLYGELERELALTVGAPETLVFPSISLLHLGVLPALAGFGGVILTDAASHHSMLEACMRARADGTEWIEFRHNDLADLEGKLAKYAPGTTKIIATDGVYSMGSANPPLAEYSRLAKRYNAIVYVDDAHGFGVLGAGPDESLPYGHGGAGLVRHLGLDYRRDRIVYVAGLSKAFSSYAAFVACHDEKMKSMLQTSGPYVFSGPTAVACLATAIAGLRLNRRDGDARRRRIHRLAKRLVSEALAIGFEVDNDGDFPIVGIVIGGWDAIVSACQILWEHDILITPATFPAVPANRNLVRFSITSANTDQELDQAIIGLRAVWNALHAVSGSIAARSDCTA